VKVAIVIKGDIAPNAVPPSAIRPILRVQEEMGTLIARPSSLLNPPASDGSFVFPNLLPATYKVLLQAGLPANMYIADIRQAGKSLYADASLTVTGESAAPVEVIVSTGASQIQGTVRHNTGAPVVASVTLVPQINRRQNPMLYKRTTSTANGEFMLRGIAPGEYKIFAWESILSGADENAEFLSKYENLGKSITITTGTALNDVQINLIPD
jgi:hypothetical protein